MSKASDTQKPDQKKARKTDKEKKPAKRENKN